MPQINTPLDQFNLAKQWLEDAIKAHHKASQILSEFQHNPTSPWERLTFHYLDKNNPHGLTKEQLDLDKVQNLPLASIEVAKAGASSNYYMNPVLTKEAIRHRLKRQGATGYKKQEQASATTPEGVKILIDPEVATLFESTVSSEGTELVFKQPPFGIISEVTLVLRNPNGKSVTIEDVEDEQLTSSLSSTGTSVLKVTLGITAQPIIIN